MKRTLLFFFVLQSLMTFAQNAASVEHNFKSGPGFAGNVECLITQPDGKIIIKGSTIYRNSISKPLIRVNPDGSVDSTFDYNPENSEFIINSIVLQPDGKVLVGGSDSSAAYRTRVIRLNADGSKDPSFQYGAVIYGGAFVNVIALQSDGKILVANKRKYTTPNKRLIRLNADGSLDTTFDIGTGFDDNLTGVIAQPDGKIVVSGNFSTFQGVNQNNLVRLNADGTKDTSFITGSGFLGSDIYSIVLQNDGKIIAGGGFRSYQGVAQRYLIRLNTDGSNDTSFTNPIDFKNMDYDYVNNICLQADGKLIVNFYEYNGNYYGDDTVYRFNSDGSYDTAFPRANFNDGANLLTGSIDADVFAIASLNDGRILIGGKFLYCRKIIDKGIVCLNADGSRDSFFSKNTGFDAPVETSIIQSDGKTIVGGYFDNYEGVTQKKMIRLNVDGSKDTSFKPDSQFNDEVETILLQSDEKILVAGKFTDFENSGRNSLVRLNSNGSRDISFLRSSEYAVEQIALQPDGKIIVSGFVDNFPTLPVRKLFRLNTDGSQDISFRGGSSDDFNKTGISSIVVQPDGKILVGGAFTTFNRIAQKYLVRLNPDGSKDTSFDVATLHDLAINVSSITLQPDGKILVSGIFDLSQGDYNSFLVRLNSDGSKDSSFNQGIGSHNVRSGYSVGINALVLQPDGKILVGGEFDTFNGIAQNRFTRLNYDGSIDTTFDIGNGFDAPVYSISLFPDGKINIGGNFSSYKNVTSSYFIRLKGTYVKPSVNATTIQTNATCIDSFTGSASIVSVYDGKAPYTYLWSNGEKTPKITGLAAGNYSCTITDNEFSSITKDFVIITDTDSQRPTIKTPPTLIVNANEGCTATGIVLEIPVASDNCKVVSIINDAPAIFPLGNTTITWTVKDASNNSATATQIVTVKGPNLTISYSGGKLSVAETGATYKWLTCNNGAFTIIPNENKSFFTPKSVGSYAVEVTKNGCVVTSACFNISTLGSDDFDMQESLKLYPNPVKDFVTIEIKDSDNTKLDVFDVTGRVVTSKELKTTYNRINISTIPTGTYLFKISNDKGTTTKKVIKE